MKRFFPLFSPSFALISVLALVSLAALTATAFLASARLERQATRSLRQTVQLEMALSAGERCAQQIMGDATQPSGGPNFVTTLYRGPAATDYTNESGYLFIGQPNSANNLKWTYFAGFSPATLTRLDTNDIESSICWTNTQQGAFSNEISGFMTSATNGFSALPSMAATSKICTLLPLLGGRTSPPVGWVYLYQEKRIFGTASNTIIPVARAAWFMEDLSGMIDIERMGATANRTTGTNPEEISLLNMFRAGGGTVLTSLAKITNSTARKLLFTPGLLANPNLSDLTNTNDLRYFATGLREWRPTNAAGTNGTVSWIPAGIFARTTNANQPRGYKDSGYLKMDINQMVAAGNCTNLANFIRANLPDFTNRAGGMNGNNYLYALAANMIDYADTDSNSTPFTINGITGAGFDSSPYPTIIFDQISLAAKTLTVNTYWQFWNCSSTNSPAVTYACTYDFADTLGSYTTTTAVPVPGSPRMQPTAFIANLIVPALDPGCSAIVSMANTINLESPTLIPAGVSAANLQSIWINGTGNGQKTTNNKFRLTLNGQVVSELATGFERKAKTLIKGGAAEWSGGMPGLRYDNVAGTGTSFKVPPSGDPRMLLYLTNSTPTGYLSACDYDKNVEWGLGFAQTRGTGTNAFNGSPYSGKPGNWTDGANSTNTTVSGTSYPDATAPTTGTSASKSTILAPLSNLGRYTNICQLGEVFDPLQWISTTITKPSMWVNCDIAVGNSWSANSMYGGGSTLRIGRPEHSRFAWTNLGATPASQPIPNMGQSAAAFLDLFCLSNPSRVSANGIYRTGGKINLNTAPPPVLAALAGGITLTRDPNKVGAEVNTTMISAFTNGVMRFRSLYPFLTPSQLAFISANYGATGWTNSANWTQNAVFGTNSSGGGLTGVTSLNDAGREEWFSKIYELASVSSDNYRFYLAAQLVDTNLNPVGPIARKYCQYAGRPDTSTNGANTNTSYGINIFSWTLTTGQKKVSESPY